MDKNTHQHIAASLDQAERERTPRRQISAEHPGLSLDDAYAIQRAWVSLKMARGARLRGRKIGLTSKALQHSVGVSEPAYGVLLDDMFYTDGAEIPYSRFIEPRVEVELAFVLGKPLRGPHCTLFDVLSAVDYVTPALEIIDSRLHRLDPETGQGRKVADTLADNTSSAALVLGGRPFKPMEADLSRIAAVLRRNHEVEATGVAASVLNNPANGPAWLANKLEPEGVQLEAGEIILCGTFTPPSPARPGDTYSADYGCFGSITCYFK
jgi:2-oxo-hept-3-ene-1,7-dioate hydratase